MVVRRNILLVEDNADIRFLLSFFIRQAGHQLECAGSGREALALLADTAFDLIVTDIGLPDFDGFELLKRAAAIRKTECITISAFPFLDDPAARAHRFAHLVKPFDPSELVALISKVPLSTGATLVGMTKLFDPRAGRTNFRNDTH